MHLNGWHLPPQQGILLIGAPVKIGSVNLLYNMRGS